MARTEFMPGWFLEEGDFGITTIVTTTDHGSLAGLGDDDHTQYGALSQNESVTGQWSFTNATAPIIVAKLGPSSTQQHTLPVVASDTVALLAAAQTLVSKTLSQIQGALDHDGSTVGFYAKAPAAQATASANLTDNSGGTANDTVQALTDPADAPATADALRDDLVLNLIPELRNNLADLAAKVNKALTVLRDVGLMAT